MIRTISTFVLSILLVERTAHILGFGIVARYHADISHSPIETTEEEVEDQIAQINLSDSREISQTISPKTWRSRGWHQMRKMEGHARNIATHRDEMAESHQLGFARVSSVPTVPEPTQSWNLTTDALGMGSNCPFEDGELIFAVPKALSAEECEGLRAEAADLLSTGKQYTYTLADSVREVAVHQLPQALEWFNSEGLPRLAGLAARCFPAVVDDPRDIWVYDALVIHYEASTGKTHTPLHRDSSLITFVIPLVERDQYMGGGTFLESLQDSLTLDMGGALVHASALRHGGRHITGGSRWVLAVFLDIEKMPAGAHGRRFHQRANWIAQTLYGEIGGRRGSLHNQSEGVVDIEEKERTTMEEELQECFAFAIEETDGSDFEVFCNIARHCLQRGRSVDGLRFLQRASELNPMDHNVRSQIEDLHRSLSAKRRYLNN